MTNCFPHLDVLFGEVSPESLLSNMIGVDLTNPYVKPAFKIDSSRISEATYCHFARNSKKNARLTEDELIQRYRQLVQSLNKGKTACIFSLLDDYAHAVLQFSQPDPMVRQENILEWRERSLLLGQDLFTCAGQAASDLRNFVETDVFTWPQAIRPTNIPLQHLLERGCSENHYHLNGSTQVFPIAWCYLMNHPTQIGAYFSAQVLQENYKTTVSAGIIDNVCSWNERIHIAAWLRVKLFSQLNGFESPKDETFRKLYNCPEILGRELETQVEVCRWEGARLEMSHGAYCLDYAITRILARKNSGPNRLLAGERSFLYQCFFQCFKGNFTKEQKDMFYLYLIIKLRFRNELVQSNDRMGFQNFSNYDKRKALIWGMHPFYWEESYNLSLAGALTAQHCHSTVVRSIEARIMPRTTRIEYLQNIQSIDLCVQRAIQRSEGNRPPLPSYSNRWEFLQRAEQTNSYFFVYHFAKRPLLPQADLSISRKKLPLKPRNSETRNRIEQQAKALDASLATSGYLRSRVRGIDACSHEIGCRPETFATVFRYLRRPLPGRNYLVGMCQYFPQLNASFHVGEDFLDLTDGLRAIDEAICFLNLRQGDRLGHAIALGVFPAQYYRIKENCTFLPAQDLLDNLVWLLFRSLEWGVDIAPSQREAMSIEAAQLLEKIYPALTKEIHLRDYYQAWMLRGDNPELYRDFPAASSRPQGRGMLPVSNAYLHAMCDPGTWTDTGSSNVLQTYRKRQENRLLLYRYHFGYYERRAGEEISLYSITPEYIALVEKMQLVMMKRIMEKGIAIECNPSSNKLIGTFDRYEQHPIFRFNSYGLDLPEHLNRNIQLRVSINTDDMGVFDTSLENEYAMLFAALSNRKTKEGEPLLSQDEILAYLDHLRMMGNEMTFEKTEQKFTP